MLGLLIFLCIILVLILINNNTKTLPQGMGCVQQGCLWVVALLAVAMWASNQQAKDELDRRQQRQSEPVVPAPQVGVGQRAHENEPWRRQGSGSSSGSSSGTYGEEAWNKLKSNNSASSPRSSSEDGWWNHWHRLNFQRYVSQTTVYETA